MGRKPRKAGRRPTKVGRKQCTVARKPRKAGRRPTKVGRKQCTVARKPRKAGRRPRKVGRKQCTVARKPRKARGTSLKLTTLRSLHSTSMSNAVSMESVQMIARKNQPDSSSMILCREKAVPRDGDTAVKSWVWSSCLTTFGIRECTGVAAERVHCSKSNARWNWNSSPNSCTNGRSRWNMCDQTCPV